MPRRLSIPLSYISITNTKALLALLIIQPITQTAHYVNAQVKNVKINSIFQVFIWSVSSEDYEEVFIIIFSHRKKQNGLFKIILFSARKNHVN